MKKNRFIVSAGGVVAKAAGSTWLTGSSPEPGGLVHVHARRKS